MTTVIQRADKPAVSIRQGATVKEAVLLMVDAHVGAVVVVDNGVIGIFSERDLMTKVVQHALNPATTTVASVMTAPAVTILPGAPLLDAIVLMRKHHIRHLPVVEPSGRILGMLSVRHLLHDRVEYLEKTVQALEAYASYDGASG